MWESYEPPQTSFSYLTLSGVIMLSIYLVPLILRPIDTLFNLKQYAIGMAAYFLMLPVYTNLMQIYSMCNLHDLSWGNRPAAAAGAEALSDNAKK